MKDSPYGLNLYILLDCLTKSELASNVITKYYKHPTDLVDCVNNYDE